MFDIYILSGGFDTKSLASVFIIIAIYTLNIWQQAENLTFDKTEPDHIKNNGFQLQVSNNIVPFC